MAQQGPLRLPVVSSGAEYLVMGFLMRRNTLTYKASEHNEGYDLICIHPDPRYVPREGELAQVRVQVKSRYATDCDRSFPIREASIDAFDYLIVVFQNIGNFFGRSDGSDGEREPEFFTLPREFVREHHDATSSWQRVKLRGLASKIEPYQNDQGFESIAQRLGVVRPTKIREERSGPNSFLKTPIE